MLDEEGRRLFWYLALPFELHDTGFQLTDAPLVALDLRLAAGRFNLLAAPLRHPASQRGIATPSASQALANE
ncbi:hypothetical protein AB3X91_27760 [Paraburkholderia sp. BR14263]|uniref:hypothetical protein n=1 Tax=unclassified Paraburkholderia TaxID=2615204 RepID=UPI0034CFE2FF